MQGRHSVVDVACARPDAPPLVIEEEDLTDALAGQPEFLTGFRHEGGEAPCLVVFSTRGMRRRTRQYVEHPEVRKRR